MSTLDERLKVCQGLSSQMNVSTQQSSHGDAFAEAVTAVLPCHGSAQADFLLTVS